MKKIAIIISTVLIIISSMIVTAETPKDFIPLKNILLNSDNIRLKMAETFQIIVSFTPKNATNQDVIYKSSDDNIIKASQDGTITATGDGEATVTVTSVDGKFTAIANVLVDQIDSTQYSMVIIVCEGIVLIICIGIFFFFYYRFRKKQAKLERFKMIRKTKE